MKSVAWVSEPRGRAAPLAVPPILNAEAVWDTAASQTVIAERIAQELGLLPEGSALVNHLGGSGLFDVYTVDIALRNGIRIADLEVLCGDCPGCDVLIGMDIIGLGDFAVSNFQGETVMSFRTPSVAVTDYETAQAEQQ